MVTHGENESQLPSGDVAPCFEDALAELETIVHQLEEGQLGLAEALARLFGLT